MVIGDGRPSTSRPVSWVGAAVVVAEHQVVAAPARFGRGGGQDTSETSTAFGIHAACRPGMCRGHAHGEKEGTVAADHRILVWRRIARRCCRHPCHLRVRRTIGTNGAWCSGMYWCVCGLVCGALSAAPWGGGLAARGRPSPSSEHSVGQRRTPRARRFAATRSHKNTPS